MNFHVTAGATALTLALVVGAPARAETPADGAAASTDAPARHAEGRAKKGGGKKNSKDGDGIGPFKKKDYPTSERIRPLVLPDKMGEFSFGLGIGKAGETTTVGADVNIAYGLRDILEVGVGTGLLLSPDADWNRSLPIQLHVLAYDDAQFDFAPGVVIPLSLVEGAPFSIAGDLPCRYVLGKGAFLRFGQGALPIMLSPDFGLGLAANGGVGFQIDNKTVATIDTNVAQVNLAPESGLTGIWDTLALTLGAQYTPTKTWDVGARLNLYDTWGVEGSFFWNLGLYGAVRF